MTIQLLIEIFKIKHTEIMTEKVRCLIIGSGPAGYTAAIYASRANLSPVLYEGMQPGGQLTTTNEVENFPGYASGITGPELMEDLKKQAERFGADIRFGMATATDLSAAPYKITIDGEKEILADTVIISTGATAKYLGLPDETKYAGSGVSACATCDGVFLSQKNRSCCGWWRHSLRRSNLPSWFGRQSIFDCTQTIFTCEQNYARACFEKS